MQSLSERQADRATRPQRNAEAEGREMTRAEKAQQETAEAQAGGLTQQGTAAKGGRGRGGKPKANAEAGGDAGTGAGNGDGWQSPDGNDPTA